MQQVGWKGSLARLIPHKAFVLDRGLRTRLLRQGAVPMVVRVTAVPSHLRVLK
jgi:hypothetical protein